MPKLGPDLFDMTMADHFADSFVRENVKLVYDVVAT